MGALPAQEQEASPGLLSGPALARLTASLILAEQADLVARGQMPAEAMIPLRDARLSAAARDGLTIDEGGLGFDSLSRLGLVLRINRFFGLSATGIEDYLLVQRRFGDWVALIAEHQRLVGRDLALTFDTSGSSGPVKHLTHSMPALQAEITAQLQEPLAHLGPEGRILAMVPPHHIYGCLFTCLLPDRLGNEVLALHDLSPTAVFRHARPGDLIVGTPFTWDLLRQCRQTLPQGVFGLTSAGPSTAATWSVRAELGLSRLTEIYGSTETGGIGTRTEFGAAFDLLPHLHRQADEIAGPQGPLDLQDRMDWLTDRRFHLLGRKDDVVQVAGVNVSPGQLRAVLQAIPGVAEVAVRPGAERLRAFIVPSEGQDPAELRSRLTSEIARLPAPMRPAPLRFGRALPRNAMGKLADWEDEIPAISVTAT